jgi:uncharacterized ParB-like nuclease family protein
MSTTPADERRRKRSDDPLIALHYQLAHARTEGRYDAVVLAQGQWTEPGLDDTSRVAELRAEVDVQAVDVDGQTVLLCSRGGGRRTGAMDRAAAGVARILRVAA